MFKTSTYQKFFNVSLERKITPEDFEVVPESNALHLLTDNSWTIKKKAHSNRYFAEARVKSKLLESLFEELDGKLEDSPDLKTLKEIYFSSNLFHISQSDYDYRGCYKDRRHLKDERMLEKFRGKMQRIGERNLRTRLTLLCAKINSQISHNNRRFKEEMVRIFSANTSFICEENDLVTEDMKSLDENIEILNKEIKALRDKRESLNQNLYEKRKDAICRFVAETGQIDEKALFEIICEFRKTKYVNSRFPF